ncbi:MAG TPA: hypothetical protein VFS91_06430, partial [Nitrobacter sp.]|nr:hypothetical protein [Nitrobacter sp.]
MAAPTPPAEAQAVASLREMLELREATQNGRVTDKPELDIVRDARAALSAQPRPEALNLDALAGLAVSVDVDGLFDSEGRRLFGEVTHWQKNEGSPHGIILLIQDPEPNWKAVPQPASAPAGVAGLVQKWRESAKAYREAGHAQVG